ncbi:dipeptidyl peptidase 3 [Coprobacter tertius]|uniref:Dipeptidyl peptidase 3 n=1 Tax=Coprobacter tertius TaxID=2944915 RepID=A0ABT1MF49_9BACT|nr:dipeptidyl peptidase 3 [Coprobacter tertius]MCP9611262.1 dipeptidyl peptidase 3 [Coprobacter tertius]
MNSETISKHNDNNFYRVEKFADLEILRYKVTGFEELTLRQKKLLYYLSEAALQGRDILYDQNNRWNLIIRRTLEAIYIYFKGDRDTEEFKNFEIYLKRIWFSNGIHHHYSTDKMMPGFPENYFIKAVKSIEDKYLPLKKGESKESLLENIVPVIFSPMTDAKRVNQTEGEDLITTSAGNYYDGVTQNEVETFYSHVKKKDDPHPISYGLNSRLVKRNGKIYEEIYKIGGLYTEALEKVVYWLEQAKSVAENENQKKSIQKLIDFNRSGNLKEFDEYAILWVNDTNSEIDFINGFTETYGDPLGIKGSWESLVNFKNKQASERTQIISENAQWFEDNSPVDQQFKKVKVKGVSAKVITAAILGGDTYPSTPIGINLPNSNWIRQIHGSKSVTIENITEAYDRASQNNGFAEEFIWGENEKELIKKYGFLADNLHTDLHECLGHGSGQLLPGTDPDALKAYGATLEEARADLFALYYIADSRIVELNLLPDEEAYKAEYYKYMMNGLLTQLTRILPGNNLEESHMRNRQLIARWIYEKGMPDKVVELRKKEEKTYVVINDYIKMRKIIGDLLAEIQRIKSTGDFNAGKELVETYAVKVDPVLHREILERYKKLNIAPYKGFINPVYIPVYDKNGNISDINVTYKEGYAQQMLRYSKDYSLLPDYNN